jgi:uncharacterized protein YaiI (UPF0178 family)
VPRVLVDADACPVKDEVYSVAARYGVPVTLVANSPLHVPARLRVEMIVVSDGPDAADDWIAEHVHAGDVVVTADIPLASRCLAMQARVLGTNGRPFSEDSIGGALAMRELKSQLRDSGVNSGGPPPITARDRSRFLSKLDELLQKQRRER